MTQWSETPPPPNCEGMVPYGGFSEEERLRTDLSYKPKVTNKPKPRVKKSTTGISKP